MEPVEILWRLVLAPLAAALLVAPLARRLASRRPRAADGIAGLGLAAGFVVALQLVGTRPTFPLAPWDGAWTWVVWIAPAGLLIGLATSLARLPEPAAAVVRWALGTSAVWLILRPLVPHALSSSEALLSAGAWGAGAAALGSALAERSRRRAGASVALPLLLTLVATAWILLAGGPSLSMAEAGLALAAAVGGTAALAAWVRLPALPASAAPAVATTFVGLLAGAHAYLTRGPTAHFPLGATLLLLASAGGALLPRWRWGLAVALLLAGAAAAVSVDFDGPLLPS